MCTETNGDVKVRESGLDKYWAAVRIQQTAMLMMTSISATYSWASDLELRDPSALLYFNGLSILPNFSKSSYQLAFRSTSINVNKIENNQWADLRAFCRKSLMSRICFGCRKINGVKKSYLMTRLFLEKVSARNVAWHVRNSSESFMISPFLKARARLWLQRR